MAVRRTTGFSLQGVTVAVPQASACKESSPPEGGGTAVPQASACKGVTVAVPQASACKESSPPEGGGTPYRRLQPAGKVHRLKAAVRRTTGFSLQGSSPPEGGGTAVP